MARWCGLDAGPPGARAMCSSRTERATLLSSGERIDPYEQRWVMRSGALLPLVAAVPVTGRCA